MRVRFVNELDLLVEGGGWVLDAPFLVDVLEYDKPGRLIVVPTGFHTDLASVPRLPLAYLLFGGRARRSAVVHDYLYAAQEPKSFADNVFEAGMRAEGVDWFSRKVMFWAVRLFGQPVYNSRARA